MSIQLPEYELSIWSQMLDENGNITEKKELIIAARDMTYLGAARNIELETKINGTHTLTFEMPDRFYDNLKGEYVRNEFVDAIYNECRIKLFYRNEWLEFIVKEVSDSKHYKSYMKSYSCTDSFIEELSRNGYGITFDTELNNNVEEIGTFSKTILDDSAWEYKSEYNWGDFTEYSEEKLFKVPASMFKKVSAAKVNFDLNTNHYIENVYTKEKRKMELGDDLAAEVDGGYFWDDKYRDNPLIQETVDLNVDYIYIPYSELQFCYKTTSDKYNIEATEEVQTFSGNGVTSYAIAPKTTDPTALIQFIAIPKDEKVEIDEAGLIVDKKFTYVMTIKQWNENVNSKWYYKFLPDKKKKEYIEIDEMDFNKLAEGNLAIGYDGYLDKIDDIDVMYGKKISIANRTEKNISEEIDSFVTVYRENSEDFEDCYALNEDWKGKDEDYRVCSRTFTRQITPQLARNLIQNGTNIDTTDGWEPKIIPVDSTKSIQLKYLPPQDEFTADVTDEQLDTESKDLKSYLVIDLTDAAGTSTDNRTIINFGATAQEETLNTENIYCFGIKMSIDVDKTVDGTTISYVLNQDAQAEKYNKLILDKMSLILGEGSLESDGNYKINNEVIFNFKDLIGENGKNYFTDDSMFQFYFLFKLKKEIKVPYIALSFKDSINICAIESCELFKAYTKGKDFFENDGYYRYSGRDLFIKNYVQKDDYWYSEIYTKADIENKILFETDVMAGDTYEYQKYFIQQGVAAEEIKDTFKKKELLGLTDDSLFNSTKNTEDEIQINTRYIDLSKCEHYLMNVDGAAADCNYGGENHVCLYQKYGYCPYRFTAEKHCRKIRTLTGEKSNRFNLIQELSKVFEMYPIFWQEHDEIGRTKTQTIDNVTTMKKNLFYIREKGIENQLGFRYEKNLSSISRTIASDQIVTKLYVEDVDSDISKTGLCSIKTAEDNVSKDNFLINLDYYTTKGLLDKETVTADLYGKNDNDLGYLQILGHYNTEYDKLSDAIVNLQDSSTLELEANIDVNLTGIDSAKKTINKLKKQRSYYVKELQEDQQDREEQEDINNNKTYLNYCAKIKEIYGKLRGLIYDTFITEEGGQYYYYNDENGVISTDNKTDAINEVIKLLDGDNTSSIEKIKEHDWYKKHTYSKGMLGQYNAEMEQIKEWKKKREALLDQINTLSLKFFRKYEPFLKEGTWTDSNYVTDNAYYFGAREVSAEGAIPKVQYNISVVDLFGLQGLEEYEVNIADVTFVEDIGMFGYKPNGLPNRLKVLVSGIKRSIDTKPNAVITVQNFTTQFEDLFQQVTASVQSLTFNENIYKRATNFAANKNIKTESLQGTLDTNDLTLISTEEKNIEIDKNGQSGSDINNHNNKYKLNGEGLFFSNNGGQSWNIGVGPGGINADYIKTGTLDAGKVRIVDNDYMYFLWDKDGIFAYRDPQDITNDKSSFNDFALFNRFGLSLVESGKIRLRAGYQYNPANNDSEGNIYTEQKMGDEIGFYLYDTKGNPIFMTQAGETDSAAIALKGEIFVTDSNINIPNRINTVYKYKGDCYERKKSTSTVDFKDSDYISSYSKTISSVFLTNSILTIKLSSQFNINNIMEYIAYAANKISSMPAISSLTIQIKDSFDFLICIISNATFIANNSETITLNGNSFHRLRFNCNYKWTNDGAEQSLTDIFPSNIYFKPNTNQNFTSSLKGSYYEKTSGRTTYSITKISSGDSTRVKITDKNYLIQEISVIENNTEQKLTVYYDGESKYYTEREEIKTVINNEDFTKETVLFLNNKISAEESVRNENERLFCCATKDAKEPKVINIFSVLKNGFLYMGGEIKSKEGNAINTPKEIPDTISIENEFLRVSYDNKKSGWGMYMRFNSFYDLETGDNLLETINSKIAEMKLIRHKHEIKKLQMTINTSNAKNKNKKYIYLPDSYSSIDALNHVINDSFSLKDFIVGLTTGGTQKGLSFNRKVALVDEEYEYSCKDSYTEECGLASDGSSSNNNSSNDSGKGLLRNPIGE